MAIRESKLRRSVASRRLSKPRIATVLLILAAWFMAWLLSPEHEPLPGKPSHHTTLGFRNLHVKDPQKSFFSFLYMRMFGDNVWADHTKTANEVPWQSVDLDAVTNPGDKPQLTWLGHSTFLIQHNGLNILTDPIFSDRASPFSFAGPKRYTAHAIDYALLPAIDYVIISHNHYDHLDDTAVEILANQPVYLVPLGLKDWLMGNGVQARKIIELDWWQDTSQNAIISGAQDVQFEAQPSQHWSARGLFDRRKTLWASWLVTLPDFRFWFAGDTGYNPITFKEIGEKNGAIDIALIPIGAYAPRSFMGTYHVNPEEAVKIHLDVKAEKSFGMHWGTYPLTAEEPLDPIARLGAARASAGIGFDQFETMSIGETRTLQ